MILQGNQPHLEASLSLKNRLARQVWNLVWMILFRTSPRPFHRWRAFLLCLFGAKLGKQNHIYPGVKIWAPWNLQVGDHVGVGDGVNLYNMAPIELKSFSVISQGAHLCAGTHDFNSPNFQLQAFPISVNERAWVCTEAFIGPGVSIPEGCVIGARSVVTKTLTQAWGVYAGNPCRKIGERQIHTTNCV